MSYKHYITEKAENDLINICAYISKSLKSPKAKDDLIKAIDEKLKKICEMPTAYQICEYPPLLVWKIRYAIVKRYKLYFWIDEKSHIVHILYIKHQLQDEKQMLDEKE